MGLFSKLIRKFSHSVAALSVFILISGTLSAQDGEKLFKANCSSCHKVNKKLVGPALKGAEDRWESQEALYSWIKNSADYLKNNPDDSYAHELFEKFNKSPMSAQALSDDEIAAILTYVREWEDVVVESPGPGTAAAPVQAEDYSAYWLVGLILVLLIVLKVMLDVKSSLQSVQATLAGETIEETGFVQDCKNWLAANKRIAVAGVLILIAASSVQLWFVVKNVGVYEGYAPEQPIKFSHKIHAGDNQIDCGYCHTSAYKGKTSGIPSVNVCMNCHKGISEGKVWGTEEIAKIYEAAGYDPETMSYSKEPKPIEWVRIHNLPDFAYFNHSQHVVVGKQKCQTCHGPVEEFGYPMKQHADLTMGWCVNCHRETKVAMEGNGYYDKIHEELKEKYKDKPIKEFTVEHIGGLECAKCHY